MIGQTTFKQINQICYCCFSQEASARGFLLGEGPCTNRSLTLPRGTDAPGFLPGPGSRLRMGFTLVQSCKVHRTTLAMFTSMDLL